MPVVALVHEYHDRSALEKYPLPVGITQLVVQNFLRIGLYATVIVPCEETKEALRRYGTDVPVHVVPNGLDVGAYLEPPAAVETEAFDFVVVSRLAHRKGIDRLLEAMALVVTEYPSARLGIAGSGPKRNQLERQAAELGDLGERDVPWFRLEKTEAGTAPQCVRLRPPIAAGRVCDCSARSDGNRDTRRPKRVQYSGRINSQKDELTSGCCRSIGVCHRDGGDA